LCKEARESWEKAAQVVKKTLSKDSTDARERMITPPGQLSRLLDLPHPELAEEDDESAHPDMRAMTRQSDSVEVVVLHVDDEGVLYLDSACTQPVPLELASPETALPIEKVRRLLDNVVSISYEGIITHVRSRSEADLPDVWRQAAAHTPALRYKHPLCFRQRQWTGGGHRIDYDSVLGLIVSRA